MLRKMKEIALMIALVRELQEKEKTRAAHALAQIGIDFTNG